MTRAVLEVAYLACGNRKAFITNTYNIYFPYILFIDDFGGHRNICRLMRAFYLIPIFSAMENGEGWRMYPPLTMGPHGADQTCPYRQKSQTFHSQSFVLLRLSTSLAFPPILCPG